MKKGVRKIGTLILALIFWAGVIFTFVLGCKETFFKSNDEQQEDYEEYIHSTIP